MKERCPYCERMIEDGGCECYSEEEDDDLDSDFTDIIEDDGEYFEE